MRQYLEEAEMKELLSEVAPTISHYRILSRLGAGGMGEVYLAEDARLDRKVALKVLPNDSAPDQKRMRRFLQEAKLASSLSHPNICVIHEVGETDNHLPFIAMEYIEGQTIAERIKGRALAPSEIIEIGIQVADALDEAHSRGITHRDIKPANLMVTGRGKVKVLDFGLAKAAAATGPFPITDITTQANTEPGLLMGTVQYMSPEQALGREVDHRTDIFSLGVALYEMTTGRLPFYGTTASETIDKIIHAQPEAIARFNYDIPAELERIIRKALRKDVEARYQTAKDLLVDLRNLKQEMEVEDLLERSLTPGSSGSVSIAQATGDSPIRISETRYARTATSSEYSAVEIRRRRRGAAIIAAITIIVLAVIGFALYKLLGRDKAPAPFQTTKITKITTNGNADGAAISPDGKYVAYVMNEGGKQSLWISQVAIASNIRIIAPAEAHYWDLTFSPDGNYIYYGMAGKDTPPAIYQVPVLGGSPKKALGDLSNPVRFSSDGKRIAFVRNDINKKESFLFIANADGSDEQLLGTRSYPSSYGLPAWSPDAKSIVCSTGGNDSNGLSVIEINLADRTERTIPTRKWQEAYHLGWLSDGSGLIMAAKDYNSSYAQIWFISYPDGQTRKITNELSDYGLVSLTADSRTLVTMQMQRLSNVWVTPGRDARKAMPITSGAGRYFDMAWTPDGHLLYASDASGNADIWEMNADGTGQKQLTSGAGRNYGPTASPDGRYIVFHSNRNGTWNIWRMDRDGSNAKQLTNDSEDSNWPQVSPDGQWVVYQRAGNGALETLWKVSIGGGAAMALTDKVSVRPSISPDGKMIACWYWNEESDSSVGIALIPIDGGPPIKFLAISPTTVAGWFAPLRWTADGRALTYVESRAGADNIWQISLDGKKPVELTDFKSDRIETFNWSRDGKLVCSRGVITRDILMISDLK